jgi:surface protein
LGYIQELVLYTSDQTGNRQGIEYNINSYFNIYTQPVYNVNSNSLSLFSSPTVVAGAANAAPTQLITGGPLGLITVTRTGSSDYALWKNKVPNRVTLPASLPQTSSFFLNAANVNSLVFSSSQNNVAYASVGAGLTDSEVGTYYDLVDAFQTNLGRRVSNPGAFITLWDTRLTGSGTSNSSSVVLPLYGTQAITASWGDGTTSIISSSAQVDRTHVYATPGIYTVTITGSGQGFQFANTGDRTKLLDIGQWGSISASINQAFQGATNVLGTAADYPPLQTTTLNGFFAGATRFNGNINNWNVVSCSNFTSMFQGATAFNQSLGNWTFTTTGSVSISMNGMFSGASNFNQDIGSWNTIRVTNMNNMFRGNGMKFNNGGSDSIKNWNTSNVTNMGYMFWRCAFNQPIGTWNVGNVTNFDYMFWQNPFNQNIGAWNVEKATSMSEMFGYSSFNNSGSSDINNWRPISCSNFSLLFRDSSFNQPVGNWPISASNINMQYMFLSTTAFNQNLGLWDVSKVTNMTGLFQSATTFNNSGSNAINNWRPISCSNFSNMFNGATAFNQPIGNWPLSASSIDMSSMFNNADAFNQNIGSWNVEKVINMSSMFNGNAAFNNSGSSDINNWRPISCSNFSSMFQSSVFNQPIGNWPISASNINMSNMFLSNTAFNQNIGSWDVSKVTNMANMFYTNTTFNNSGSSDINNWRPISCSDFEAMFYSTSFNQPIGDWTLATDRDVNLARMFRSNGAFNQDITTWNTSRVTRMDNMFDSATSFNQPIGNWDTSNVTLMDRMFSSATAFNQDIGSWNVGKVIDFNGFMASKTTYSYLHTIYDGWINNKLQPNVTAGFGTNKYSGSAAEGRALLTRTYNTASITGYSNDGGFMAITCSVNHNVIVGNKIFMSGSSFAGINGVQTVLVAGSPTTLTLNTIYDPTATGGTAITGYGWSITDGGVV